MKKDLPHEIERKYLILMPDEQTLNSLPQCDRTEIVQVYLNRKNTNTTRRIRKRGTVQKGYKYYYTEKTPVAYGEKIEIEHEISADEYNELIKDIDINGKPIEKERYCFTYKNQLFELDVYAFSDELATLEIELDNINNKVELPDFLTVLKDVTNDNRYSNASLSKTGKLHL